MLKLKKDKRLKWKLHGKNIVKAKEMNFWYFWGNREFDIRDVRKAAGLKKSFYASDTDLKNPCGNFMKNMSQLEKIAGNDFKTLLDEADNITISNATTTPCIGDWAWEIPGRKSGPEPGNQTPYKGTPTSKTDWHASDDKIPF